MASPPQHTRMRRIVSRGFTPRIKEMATAIEEIVERCLAGIEDQRDLWLRWRNDLRAPGTQWARIRSDSRVQVGRNAVQVLVEQVGVNVQGRWAGSTH